MVFLSHLFSYPSSNSSSATAASSRALTNKNALKFIEARRRLQKELKLMMIDPPSHCSGGLVGNDIFKWQGAIMGPIDTPFEGGVFFVSIQFPVNYPYGTPEVKFQTKVYHPNVDLDGTIHLDILKENWSPAMTIQTLLLSICSFLPDPNAENSLNPISYLYKNERKIYNEKARAWTQKYAMG